MEVSELRIAVKSELSASEHDDLEALVTEARWNQNAKDWRLFLQLGRIYAAHTATSRIVATTATLPYGERFAWIIRYAGPKTWEEADAAYYAAPERTAMQPDPARHIARSESWLIRPVGEGQP